MGSDENAHPMIMSKSSQPLEQRTGRLAVQRPGRLIGEQNGLFAGQGPCDPDSLALSTGHVRRRTVTEVTDSQLLESVIRALIRLAEGHPPGQERNCDVLPRSELRDEIVVLEYDGDILQANPGTFLLRESIEGDTSHHH